MEAGASIDGGKIGKSAEATYTKNLTGPCAVIRMNFLFPRAAHNKASKEAQEREERQKRTFEQRHRRQRQPTCFCAHVLQRDVHLEQHPPRLLPPSSQAFKPPKPQSDEAAAAALYTCSFFCRRRGRVSDPLRVSPLPRKEEQMRDANSYKGARLLTA
jgi:hypothetical protein